MRAGAYAGAPQSDKKRGISSKTAVLIPFRHETSGTIFWVAFFSKIQNAPESRKGGSAKRRKRGTRRSGTLCAAKENRSPLYGKGQKQGVKEKAEKQGTKKRPEDGGKARRKKTEEEGQSRRNQKTPARCFGKAFALCFFCIRFRRFSDCQRERRAKKSRNRENYRVRRSKIFPSRSFQRSSPPSNTA